MEGAPARYSLETAEWSKSAGNPDIAAPGTFAAARRRGR